MSEWITHRKPKASDAHKGVVWATRNDYIDSVPWRTVNKGEPWQPIKKPTPFPWNKDEDGDRCNADDVAELEASHAELLDAAKEVIGWWGYYFGESVHVSMDRLRSAIAKAEGGLMP